MREGWEYKKLNEVCDKGSSNLVISKLEENHGDYPLYGASGVVKGVDFYQQDKPYIGIVKDGAGVGRVNVYPAKSSLVGTMQYIFPKEGCDIEYIKYFLEKLDLSKHISGATIPHIYFKDYGKESIPLPPLTTQQRIVSELNKISHLIELKKKELEIYDKLAQSLFFEMFGDPVENEKGWEVQRLGDLGELGRGVSKHRPRNAPELLGGTMPLIQTGDVANADFEIRSYSSTYSEIGVAQSKIWKKGTLCITIAATIGKCAILGFDACFPDSVVGFTPSDKVNTIYMFYIFSNMQKMLEEYAPGVAQKNINLKILNELSIPVPSLTLQEQFANRIKAIENQKANVNKAIEKLTTLLNSRMDFWYTIETATDNIMETHDARKIIEERYDKVTEGKGYDEKSLPVCKSANNDQKYPVYDIDFGVLARIYVPIKKNGHLSRREINTYFAYDVYDHICVLVELGFITTEDYEIFQIC